MSRCGGGTLSSGLPVPEEAESHEEKGRNMAKSSAADQIAEDLTIRQRATPEGGHLHATISPGGD